MSGKQPDITKFFMELDNKQQKNAGFLGNLTKAIAAELGLNEDEKELAYTAGLLYEFADSNEGKQKLADEGLSEVIKIYEEAQKDSKGSGKVKDENLSLLADILTFADSAKDMYNNHYTSVEVLKTLESDTKDGVSNEEIFNAYEKIHNKVIEKNPASEEVKLEKFSDSLPEIIKESANSVTKKAPMSSYQRRLEDIANLNAENKDLKDENKDLKTKKEFMKEAILNLQKNAVELEEEVVQYKIEKKNLETENTQLIGIVADQELVKQDLEKGFNQQLSQKEQELKRTKEMLQISEETSNEFFKETVDLHNENAELKKNHVTLINEKSNLEVQLQTEKDEKKETQEKLSKTENQNKKLVDIVAAQGVEADQLNELGEKLQKQVIALQAELEKKEKLLKGVLNHEVSAEEKELMRKEYALSERGHTFDTNVSLEERMEKVKRAQLIEGIREKDERKAKWENRKAITKAVLKTGRDVLIKPMFNKNVDVPKKVSTKKMKEDLNTDIDNNPKVKKTIGSFLKGANQSLKKAILHSTTLEKKEELSNEGWSLVIARAFNNKSENVKKKFNKKFKKISKPLVDKMAKAKKTFHKHLENEKDERQTDRQFGD